MSGSVIRLTPFIVVLVGGLSAPILGWEAVPRYFDYSLVWAAVLGGAWGTTLAATLLFAVSGERR